MSGSDLDRFMMACSDLKQPARSRMFQPQPGLKDIKVPARPPQRTAAFQTSQRARDWSSALADLGDAFSEPAAPPQPAHGQTSAFDDDDFDDFQSCPPPSSNAPAAGPSPAMSGAQGSVLGPSLYPLAARARLAGVRAADPATNSAACLLNGAAVAASDAGSSRPAVPSGHAALPNGACGPPAVGHTPVQPGLPTARPTHFRQGLVQRAEPAPVEWQWSRPPPARLPTVDHSPPVRLPTVDHSPPARLPTVDHSPPSRLPTVDHLPSADDPYAALRGVSGSKTPTPSQHHLSDPLVSGSGWTYLSLFHSTTSGSGVLLESQHTTPGLGELSGSISTGLGDPSESCSTAPGWTNQSASRSSAPVLCDLPESNLPAPGLTDLFSAQCSVLGVCDQSESQSNTRGLCDQSWSQPTTSGLCDTSWSQPTTRGMCDQSESQSTTPGRCGQSWSEPTIRGPYGVSETQSSARQVSASPVRAFVPVLRVAPDAAWGAGAAPQQTGVAGDGSTAADDDEFGEMVSPALAAASRPGSLLSLDLQVAAEAGEVSPLEMDRREPVAADKYDNFRREMMAPCGESTLVAEWRRCLQACHQLIQEGVLLFGSVSSRLVCHQVATSRQGANYIDNLGRVHRVVTRIQSACERHGCRHQLELVLSETCKAWANLTAFIVNSPTQTAGRLNCWSAASLDADGPDCGVCLLATAGHSDEEPTLSCAGRHYHAGCANLWTNRVSRELPALQP